MLDKEALFNELVGKLTTTRDLFLKARDEVIENKDSYSNEYRGEMKNTMQYEALINGATETAYALDQATVLIKRFMEHARIDLNRGVKNNG